MQNHLINSVSSSMKNKTRIYAVGLILFVLSLLMVSVEITAFKPAFFQKQYMKLNTAEKMGMSHEDLDASTILLLDYIQDKRDDLDLKVSVHGVEVEMFNKREKDHMIDVKVLFQNFTLMKNIFFIISGIMLISALINKDIFNTKLSKDVLKLAGKYLFAVFFTISVYAIIDFNGVWTLFHKILFSNDLWLLDPRTDRMINMFPEAFFNAMVMKIIITFILLNLLVYLIHQVFLYFTKDKGVM